MKKTYVKPEVDIYELPKQQLLSVSGSEPGSELSSEPENLNDITGWGGITHYWSTLTTIHMLCSSFKRTAQPFFCTPTYKIILHSYLPSRYTTGTHHKAACLFYSCAQCAF